MKDFPLDIFPKSFFPDVELEEVTLSPDTLRISVLDSEWGLSSDMIPFWGAGAMHFAYTGPAQIRWKIPENDIWQYENSANILQRLVSFELISEQDGKRVFRFRAAEGKLVEVILHELLSIQWDGDGYDDDDDGQ